MVKCPICKKGELQKGRTKEEMYGVYLGEYPAEICNSCDESFTSGEVMQQIEAKAKEKGIWGLGKQIKVTKSGNSLAIRVPRIIAQFMHLKEGTDAFIYPKDHKLIIEAKL